MEQDKLVQVLSAFIKPEGPVVFSTLSQGLINDTYLAQDTAKGKGYVLQRINAGVFENIEGLMANVSKALKRLYGEGYHKIDMGETQNGRPFLKNENDYWRVMDYIDQSTAYNTSSDTEIAREAGRIVGRFHELMQAADPEDYVATIPQFHHMPLREQQFKHALENGLEDRKLKAKAAIDFAQRTLPLVTDPVLQQLPLRLCHNDTKLNNILFSESDDKALCLIDLDTLMPGLFLYDFGDAIRTIANPAEEDCQDLDQIVFNKPMFAAFVQGMAPHLDFLTRAEVKTMAIGAIYMPFIHGLRALTDYLLGDVYYKVAYAEQNIDRCHSLFAFAQQALDHKGYMEKTIQEVFSK
jgi:serine/threonine protein kinase